MKFYRKKDKPCNKCILFKNGDYLYPAFIYPRGRFCVCRYNVVCFQYNEDILFYEPTETEFIKIMSNLLQGNFKL